MKNILILYLIFFSCKLFSQSLILSELENINSIQDADYRPRICLVDGEPLVLFSDNSSDNKIFVQRKKDGQWLGEQQISPDEIDFQVGSLLGPNIASFGQIVYVAYIVESIPRKIAFQKSLDGGINFSPLLTAYELGDYYAEGIDVIVLPDGNPVIAFIHYSPLWTNAHQVLIRSYDQGISFTDLISIDDSPCECCTPSLILGNGTYYGISFRDNESDLRVFKTRISSLMDADFSPAITTDPTAWELSVCPASSSDGYLIGDTLYNVWMSSPFALSQVYFSKTHVFEDEILEWSEVDFSDSYGSQNHPRMAGDNQTQVVVWEEYREMKKDIFGKIIQNGQSQASFSMSQGDILSHKESVDVVFDPLANLYHIVYRNISESSVMYRSLEPTLLNSNIVSKKNLIVYPNPSKNKLNISGDFIKPFEYSILNSLGVVIQKGIIIDYISIERLLPGKYLIKLFNSDQNIYLPFIKI